MELLSMRSVTRFQICVTTNVFSNTIPRIKYYTILLSIVIKMDKCTKSNVEIGNTFTRVGVNVFNDNSFKWYH